MLTLECARLECDARVDVLVTGQLTPSSSFFDPVAGSPNPTPKFLEFGHLFASGPTREDARKSLVMALKELFIMGEIRTTVEYLGEL